MRKRKRTRNIGKSVLVIAALWMAVVGQASAQSTPAVNLDAVDAGAHPSLRALVFAPATTPVPAASPTAVPVSGGSSLIQWVSNNLPLTIAMAAAGLLLILICIIAIVVALRVWRSSAHQSAQEPPACPQHPLEEATFPGAPPRPASAPTVAGQSAPPGPGIRAASPGTVPGLAPAKAWPSPFQPSTPSPPTTPVSPPHTSSQSSLKSGQADKPVTPPTPGDTVIIRRGPKRKVLGMLVDKKASWWHFDIDKPTVTIGRAPGNNFVVEHATVSRQHAVIKTEGAQLRLYDLGSANGAFVNGRRVREPVALEDGDMVRLGEVEFVFKRIVL